MAAPHSTDNYTLSRGILHVATWVAGVVGAYSDMGNCNSIEVTPIVEKLPHHSKRQNTKVKDKTTIMETGYDLTFELDELAAVNLSKFLLGTIVAEDPGVTGELIYGLQSVSTEYALRFVEDNPEGMNKTWDFHKGTIEPGGAIALLGDEWTVMGYAVSGLADVANNPDSPLFTIEYALTS